MLSPKAKEALRKGKTMGYDKITDIEERLILSEVKEEIKNGNRDTDLFMLAFWLPLKVFEAKKK